MKKLITMVAILAMLMLGMISTATAMDSSGTYYIGADEGSVVLVAPVAPVSLPHYEGFDYTVGDALGVQATNWTNLNSGDSVLVTSGSLSYNGLLSSTGNKVSFNGGGFDPYLTFEEVTSGPVYASFIFKVTDQSAMTDLTDGGYFAAIADTTFSYDARIWVRPNPDAAGTTFDIGFGDVSSSPPTTTETYNIGDEIFVVMSYNLDDGVVSAWINPSYDDFEATILPTATITGTDATPATKLSKFFIRQDSDGETPFMELDELRLGTTWADVTPVAPVAPVSLPHYEGFDYTVGDALGVQATNWTNLNSGDSVLVTSGSLSYNGLLSSTGNKVSFNGGGFDPYLTFEEVTSGPVFASFIFKVTDQSAMTDLTDGGYFAAIADTTFSYDARIWVRPNPNAAGTTFDIGFGNMSSSPPTTTETFNIGDEIFVVMSYNIDDGTVSAWINPSYNDFEATISPAATITGVAATPATKLRHFFMRQDSDGETPFIDIDELRLGTTWAEVTPAAPVAPVSLPHYEGFDYTVGDALGVQATNWTNLNSGDSVLVTSGSLSYNGLLSFTGNKVSFNGGGFDPYLTFEEVTSGPVYASFIFKVTDQSAMTDLTDGGYFAAIADTTFSYDARMWVRPNPDAAGSTFDIGFGNMSSSPPTTTGTYTVGDAIFVVMSYNLDDGVVSAWINPSYDDFEATILPTATITGTDATPATKLSKFFIRQDSDGETPFMELDELRLGTTWAEVTPAAPVVDNDLNLTFEDDSDVANWGVHGGTSGYTTVAHNATGGVGGTGAIEFGDGGYGFYIKRPVSGTVGTQYNFTVDVKTVGWDTPATYPITIAIEGLDATPISASINALADFTSIPLTGIVSNATGYIVIAGSNTSAANAGGTIMVTIDNLVFDDAADIPDTDPPTIVVAEALNDTTVVVEFSEFVDPVTAAVLTNYSMDKGIGNPTSALVFENLVTLTLDTLASDTLYTLTVNGVQDTSSNTIVANSEITFMWQEYVPGPDLFISEYIESPTGNNKALEIYNGSAEAVDLSGYTVQGTSNGLDDWTNVIFNFPNKMLEPGEVYVIMNGDQDLMDPTVADTLLVYDTNRIVSFNGDDARAIFKGEYMIDVIGLTDGDPGASWPVAGGVGATADFTLVRKSTVTMGNIDWNISAGADETTSEWIVLPPATYKFLGYHPHTDFAGPEIIGVVTIGDSLIQVKYSEQVDSTAAVNVANYSIDGGIGSPVSAGIICMHVVTLKLGAGQLLAPNTDYMITVSNIPDLIGNVIEPNTSVLVKNIVPGDLPIDIVSSDFETTAGGWWAPAGSGSTLRILETSSFALSDDEAYDGTKSKKLTILEDSAKDGGWFVREYNPDKPDIAIDSKLFMYVKASNPDIQIRFSFYDDGTGGDGDLLASPWIDVTAHADDWQVVGVDLATTSLVKWAGGGDGALSSTNTVSLGSIQLQCPNDVDAVLYFDKLTERPNIAPVEVTFDVSMAVQSILGNYTIGSDFVDVAGSFNGWGDNAMVLADADGDSVYSYTVTGLYPGEKLEYKFRINGSWDDNTAEFPYGGPARTYTVPDTNSVVFHWYKDEDRSALGIDEAALLPKVFALHQNYPNPFNPTTTIKYDLPKEAHVKIMIFDVMGREVRTLVNTRQQAGYQAIQWNAQDNSGRHVSSGYYIYVMQADKFHKTQKMIMLK